MGEWGRLTERVALVSHLHELGLSRRAAASGSLDDPFIIAENADARYADELACACWSADRLVPCISIASDVGFPRLTVEIRPLHLKPFGRGSREEYFSLCATRPPSAAAANLDRLPRREDFSVFPMSKTSIAFTFRQDLVLAQCHSIDSKESAEWFLRRWRKHMDNGGRCPRAGRAAS
jgi:hypothetical protein